MALTRQRKIENIDVLKKHAAEASALFGVSYKGIKTSELTGIRRAFREQQLGSIVVAKNTLCEVAFRDTPFAQCAQDSGGNTLYVFALGEPPLVAKKLVEYSRKFESFIPKFALLEERLYDAAGLEAISRLPTRDVALAQLLSVMQAPVAALARTLNEIPARFVRTLDAVSRSRS